MEIRNNNTVADTFRCDDPGHECSPECPATESFISRDTFETEKEAMDFYNKTKNTLRFAGTGMYVTYPVLVGGES